MSLLEPKHAGYKPFEYPWAYEAYKKQQRAHWLPDEVPMADDIKDWGSKLTDEEKNLLTHIFRFFTQADIEVANCYNRLYASVFKPVEVCMMLSTFSAFEAIHVDAYSHLIESLKMPETTYTAFLEYKEMKDKQDYMQQFNMSTKENIAITLAAFGAFTEGLQLFASFAMLLNFPRHNKMKGMGQIITWSVRDESLSKDTSILTARGWATIDDISEDDLVAQYDIETKEISFVKPEHINKYYRKGGMIKIDNKFISSHITTSHDMLVHSKPYGYKKIHAEKIVHKKFYMPTAGLASGKESELSDLEKLLFILQADGSINKTRGNDYWVVSIKKQRKIDNLLSLNIDGVEIRELKKDKRGSSRYSIKLPKKYSKDYVKNMTWVQENYKFYSFEKCRKVINWVCQFDGYKRKDTSSINYCNTNKKAVNLMQILGTLAGYSSNISKSEDNRKDSYKDYYKVSFKKNDYRSFIKSDLKEDNSYDDKCWCVTMPKGTLVTRHNDTVLITGNTIHFTNIIRLFRTFMQENPDMNKDYIEKNIYKICEEIVHHEDKFIDLAFELGGIQGMTSNDIKQYIRYIADRRLKQLGYKRMFHIKENPIPWLDEILNQVEHANFFEARSTEYTKSNLTGEWPEKY